MSKPLIVTTVAFCLLFVPLVHSEEVAEEVVVKRASAAVIERLLESAKLNYTEEKQNLYSFKVKGYKALVIVKPGDIQLFAGFTGKRVTLNRINDWNKDHRFTRAYLSDKGDPRLESDLDFEGGVTNATLVQFLEVFAHSVEAFAAHIK